MSDETLVSTTEQVTVSHSDAEVVRAVAEISPVTVVEAPETAPVLVSEVNQVLVNETVKEIVVVTAGAQGAPGRPAEEDMPYAKRTDFVTESLIYRGEAAVGTADADAGWRIRRITIGAGDDVTEEWAGGNANFDKVWSNRAGLVYT